MSNKSGERPHASGPPGCLCTQEVGQRATRTYIIWVNREKSQATALCEPCRELLARHESFITLTEQHRAAACGRLARLRCRDAEDHVQKALADLWEAPPAAVVGVEEKKVLTNALFRRSGSNAMNEARRVRRRETLTLGLVHGFLPPALVEGALEELTPEAVGTANEVQRWLAAKLDEIRSESAGRISLTAAYFLQCVEEMAEPDYDDLAEYAGIPRQRVGEFVYKVRDRLRDKLAMALVGV